MQCPECDSLITYNTGVCSHCGSRFVPKRVRLDPSDKIFSLESEEDDLELFEDRFTQVDWDSPKSGEVLHNPPVDETKPAPLGAPMWGGFLRRAFAFVVDCAIILLMGAFMFLLSYIGYKVGLSAHGKAITMENSQALLTLVTWGWIALSAGYFVVFHGMEGKTIGKWLFGLRVVGAERGEITYKRALIRWLAAAGFAPVVLGFLWVLLSREKRAWHDIVARTWVIRD
jgi:uncharacterized RDD family membrane protein YckC